MEKLKFIKENGSQYINKSSLEYVKINDEFVMHLQHLRIWYLIPILQNAISAYVLFLQLHHLVSKNC